MALIRGRGHPYRTRVQDLEEREHAYAHGQRNPTLLRARGDVRDTVVLVHGSWGDHHNWDAVAPMLARSFRVLTYDRRGHSRSARPVGQGSLHEDAADLAAPIEGLGLAPKHVVGNSFGAPFRRRRNMSSPGRGTRPAIEKSSFCRNRCGLNNPGRLNPKTESKK